MRLSKGIEALMKAARADRRAVYTGTVRSHFSSLGVELDEREVTREMERVGYQLTRPRDIWEPVPGWADDGPAGMCIWEDCDQEAIYCKGHAVEYADFRDGVGNSPAELRQHVSKLRNLLQAGVLSATNVVEGSGDSETPRQSSLVWEGVKGLAAFIDEAATLGGE